jgi:ParB family chromosome partitioning protein
MELRHIDLGCLSVSPANMRDGRKAPDLTNILPSVRARGILVPLIVRANGSPDTFEIVAGRRRFHAAQVVAEEIGEADLLPCAVIEPGDDAAALEASLIENIARLDPDEVTRWETFTRLVREGRKPEHIAATFGLTELQVKRTLALGNLLPRIRTLYRKGDIDAATVRHLTLANKARQRDWLALVDDETAYAPMGSSLKSWLFGGSSISTKAALFDLASYKGEIVSDLFGEDRYFASAESFWAAQMEAVETRATEYREAGWTEVIVLPTGEAFHSWEHEHCPKRKGGKVFIAVSSRGDVSIHEGYISLKEARRRAKGDDGDTLAKPTRPEVSVPLASYIDLHRHAAVRAALADRPSLALRVVVAHAICGSSLWTVRVEPQRGASDAITESVESSAAEAAFDTRRRAVLEMLGFDPEAETVTHRYDGEHGMAGLVAQLLRMADGDVLAILAIVMGETLEAGTPLIELLGRELAVDMAQVFVPDDTLLDLIRDREVMDAALADVAGESVASANAKGTVKVKRGIVWDCLNGTNGRAKVENWVPRWMAFPPTAYTARGGVGSVNRAAHVAGLMTADAVSQAEHDETFVPEVANDA